MFVNEDKLKTEMYSSMSEDYFEGQKDKTDGTLKYFFDVPIQNGDLKRKVS